MAAGSCLGVLWIALMGAATQIPPALAPSPQGTADGGAAAPASLVDEIADIVERNFYSPPRLEEVGWRAAVAPARKEFAATHAAAERAAVLGKLVARASKPRTAPTIPAQTRRIGSGLRSSSRCSSASAPRN